MKIEYVDETEEEESKYILEMNKLELKELKFMIDCSFHNYIRDKIHDLYTNPREYLRKITPLEKTIQDMKHDIGIDELNKKVKYIIDEFINMNFYLSLIQKELEKEK